jgi:hypothetical protein
MFAAEVGVGRVREGSSTRMGQLGRLAGPAGFCPLLRLPGRAIQQVCRRGHSPGCRDRMPGFSHYTGSQPLEFRQ